MIKGTTPTYTYTLPFTVGTLANYQMLFGQNGVSVVEKSKEQCTVTETDISGTLTQEDTYLFNEKYPLEVQLRVKTIDGDVLATELHKEPVDICLSDEVMV